MKALLVVIAGFVLVGLAMVIVGSLLPRQHVASRSATYHAAPEQLFSLIAGPQGWRPDVLRCESIPDANRREFMRETTRDGETITYELLDRFAPTAIRRRIATENLPYSGSWTFSVQPSAEGSIVRITENGEVSNPVFRLVSLVLGHTSSIENYLRALGKATGQEQIEITH